MSNAVNFPPKSFWVTLVAERLNEKISELRSQLESVQSSVLEETKSSAGDKYETGRAMAQNEVFKLETQLAEWQASHHHFLNTNFTDTVEIITDGNLIETDFGWFLISVSVGNLTESSFQVKTISQNAPIGKLLKGKRKGDIIQINGKLIKVLQIL